MPGPVTSKRPRLSLQTKPMTGSRSRSFFDHADPRSPTAFNTLSNVYVTAIERSTPTQGTPLTAIRTHQPLMIQTDPSTPRSQGLKVQTSFTTLPGTPLSPNPISPAQPMEVVYPSTMTPTPPLSAGAVDPGRAMFTFNPVDMEHKTVPLSPVQTRRVTFADVEPVAKAPYSRNRSLHSILRNSPLQSLNAKSPSSSIMRQSSRRQQTTVRRVGYESPLTRTITTEKYIKSHIDLLAEEASPYTPSAMSEDSDIDLTSAYSGDELKDGGRTPGPFEEMRRQMTGLTTEKHLHSPRPSGISKRKTKEKKRKWVWTIGKEDEESESGAIAAVRAALGESSSPKTTTKMTLLIQRNKSTTKKRVTMIEPGEELDESGSDTLVESDQDDMDIDMSETSSLGSSEAETTLTHDLNDLATSSQRDSPIPS